VCLQVEVCRCVQCMVWEVRYSKCAGCAPSPAAHVASELRRHAMVKCPVPKAPPARTAGLKLSPGTVYAQFTTIAIALNSTRTVTPRYILCSPNPTAFQ